MRGAAATMDAIRTVARRRPWTLDAATAAALAGLVEWEIVGSDVAGPAALLVPLGLLTTLPLVLRRRLPLVVLVLVVLAVLGLDQASRVQEPQTTLLPFLVAVYSVGAHADRPAAVGLAAAILGILIDEPTDVIVLGPLTVATWSVGRLVSWRGQVADLARLAAELERERADSARLAVSDERARIACDLHDVVGHSLSLLVLQAGAERLALAGDPAATREGLAAIEQSGRATLAELRRLVGVLRSDDDDGPELAPLPGLRQLDDLVEQARRAGLPVDILIEGDPVILPPGLDVSAYRIVQEALTNTVRHAVAATAVTVRVRYGERDLTLEVVDDGRPGAPTGRDGHGPIGMRERVALYGGRLTTGPRPSGGYAVCTKLPVGGSG